MANQMNVQVLTPFFLTSAFYLVNQVIPKRINENKTMTSCGLQSLNTLIVFSLLLPAGKYCILFLLILNVLVCCSKKQQSTLKFNA